MKSTRTTLSAALIACGAMHGTAQAQDTPEFKFSGFGTVAAVHSNDKNSDFVGSIYQPNGAGHNSPWSLNPDTRLGVQGTATFNDSFSGVVQIVSQHQYDNTFNPHVEWANIKYQATPEFSLRLGRIAAPSYLLSESRFVGYASPWVRAPQEVYSQLSITSNDGLDATYRTQLGGANHAFQVYGGRSSVDLPNGNKFKSKLSWGLNDTAEIGSLSLRAGYNSLKLDVDFPTLEPVLTGLDGLAAFARTVPLPPYQALAQQLTSASSKYGLKDVTISAFALGANYDPGNWFLMSEFVAFKGAGFLSNSHSWYASGGYRLGEWTPYLAYSTSVAKVQHNQIDTTGVDPQTAGAAQGLSGFVNLVLDAFASTQHTSSIGVRWDAMKNLAVKAQYDSVNIGSSSDGRFVRPVPALPTPPSKHPKLFTVAVDFVF